MKRYQRQLALPGFGTGEQEKLLAAKVLVAGCGGLGNPVLLYLTAAGIGKIGLLDFDEVKLENLQRQVIFTEKDLGSKKTTVAAERLQQLNSEIELIIHDQKLNSENAIELVKGYDVVIDCTDNFEARYVIDDACHLCNIPMIYGALYRYEGQVAVLNYKRGIRYRDFCPEIPASGTIPDCETGGILGSMAGSIGCLQVGEAIKVITGIGEPADGKLVIMNMLDLTIDTFEIQKTSTAEHQKIENKKTVMKEITPQEFLQMKESGEDFQLVDVREPYEADQFNLGGELIPMNTIPDHVDSIERDKKVVVYCRSGMRSAQVIQYLEQQHRFENLYNLRGGIMYWIS